MTDAGFDAALESVVAATGVAHYRYLTREHPDPKVRDAYRGWVVRESRGEPHPPASPLVPVDYGDPPARPCGGCP